MDPLQQRDARLHRGSGKGRKSAARGGNGAIEVNRRPCRHFGDAFAARRIDHRQRLRARELDPSTVNIGATHIVHDGPHDFGQVRRHSTRSLKR